MKKTINVNIGGFVFHLDEDAYEKMQTYLQTLKSYFGNSEGNEEIMEDIQSRIAEIFRDRLDKVREVVSMADVDHMIGIMGKPEEYLDEVSNEKTNDDDQSETKVKRLYRDPDNKVLGGVCGGLGAYFGIDPVIFRVLFAIVFFVWGSGFLVYLVLWIAMPKAKTTSEKLQMKGSKVNISSIEKSVKNEIGGLKHNTAKTKLGRALQDFFNALAQIILTILKYIGKIAGITLMVFSLVILVLLIRGLFFNGSVNIHSNDLHVTFSAWQGLKMLFDSRSDIVFSLIGLSLFLFVPLVLLMYNGVKILFSIKKKSKILNIVVAIIWTSGLIICLFQGIKLAENYRHQESITSDQIIPVFPTQTLYLKTSDITKDSMIIRSYGKDYKGKVIPMEEVYFDIERNEKDSLVRLEVTRYARGRTWDEAGLHVRRVNYQVSNTDSTLIFSPVLLMSYDDKFRDQEVKISLKLPDEQKIYLHKSMSDIIHDVDNIHDMWDEDMLGKVWIMKKEGLTCYSCTQSELDKIKEDHTFIEED